MTWPARLAMALIRGYQLAISPYLGRTCRFAPTCSEYTRLAIEGGLARGIWLGLRRLGRCHPFHPGGYDPPPAMRPRRA
jgi:uncharacterized protein